MMIPPPPTPRDQVVVGKPLAKQVDDLADQWAFLAWRLGGTVEA